MIVFRHKQFFAAAWASCCVVALLVGCEQSHQANFSPQQITLVEETLPAPASEKAWRIVGVGSCTASGCHGGGSPAKVVGSEYNIWISGDPHANAYSELYDEASVRMVHLLDGKQAAAPHENQRCLVCHSTSFAPARDLRVDVHSDGVGCEACHGPAEGWLAAHYQRTLSAAERRELGMWDTKSLAGRAAVCTDCHVGGPGREVNHDLIAAGHPRLQFEMGAFYEALPKHWDERQDRRRQGGYFDTFTWALGQAAASQAALEQLARRAESDGPWPELSEWSCSACHHDLLDDVARQRRLARDGLLSGRNIAWDAWNHHLVLNYLPAIEQSMGFSTRSGANLAAELLRIKKAVESSRTDRGEIARDARQLSSQLGQWIALMKKATPSRAALDDLSERIVATHAQQSVDTWSAAVQTYDALASLHQSRLETAQAGEADSLSAVTASLKDMYTLLVERYADDPATIYRPTEFRAVLEEYRQRLQKSEGNR